MAVFRMGAKKLTAEYFKDFLQNCKGFDRHVGKVNFLKLGDGVCQAELRIEEEDTNPLQTLHGAYMSTLVDTLSTIAVMTHERCPVGPNLSVNLNLSFMKTAMIGDEILIDAQTLRIGKTLAHVDCQITNKATGELLLKAAHSKSFITPKNL